MRLLAPLFFLLGFVFMFSLGLAFADDKCAVYYNYHSQTKMAYIKKLHPYIIIGNLDMVTIMNNKIYPLVPFYIRIEPCDDTLSDPSVITLDKISLPSPAAAQKEDIKPLKLPTIKEAHS